MSLDEEISCAMSWPLRLHDSTLIVFRHPLISSLIGSELTYTAILVSFSVADLVWDEHHAFSMAECKAPTRGIFRACCIRDLGKADDLIAL